MNTYLTEQLDTSFQSIAGTPLHITCGMRLLWEMTADLQQQFDLASAASALDYYVYCREILICEMPHIPMQYDDIAQNYLHNLENTKLIPITPYMRHFSAAYSYLAKLDITDPVDRWSLWEHVLCHSSLMLKEPVFAACVSEWLQTEGWKPFPVPGNEALRLPLVLAFVLRKRPDVVAALDSAEKILQWCATHGVSEIPVLMILKNIRLSYVAHQREYTLKKIRKTHIQASPPPELAPGINVIGHGFSESGIGEDARSAIRCCVASDIPVSLYNVPLSLISRQQNKECLKWARPDWPHKANLYCLPGPEIVRTFFSSSNSLRQGRCNIVAPPWELPHWPLPLRFLLDAVDEFWAPSSYIAKALQEATTKPVLTMPLSVSLSTKTRRSRSYFNIPDDLFLFLFTFDWLSWPQRKNPEGVLKAFSAGFKYNKNVGLVIKTMNAGNNIHILQDLLIKYGLKKRVYLIDTVLEPCDVHALYTCVNAYVSLHRSEGFGRTLAEAMLSGIPVIATNYSGNTDFCTDETAFLVDGPLVPLKSNDYLFYENQQWCAPDIDQAAEMMKNCFQHATVAASKAAAGQQHIATYYSTSYIGEKYLARLVDIGILSQ